MTPVTLIGSFLATALALALIFAVSYTAVSFLHVIVSALHPRPISRFFGSLPPHAARWVKAAHIFFCICWVGGAASILLLSIMSRDIAENQAAHLVLVRGVDMLDTYIITPSALLCVASGLFISLMTRWGVAKYPWIIAKQAISAWALFIGLIVVRARINGMLNALERNDFAPEFHYYSPASMVIGAVQMSLLLILVFISVIKPWKKTASPQ